jgi:hypothetical protein
MVHANTICHSLVLPGMLAVDTPQYHTEHNAELVRVHAFVVKVTSFMYTLLGYHACMCLPLMCPSVIHPPVIHGINTEQVDKHWY